MFKTVVDGLVFPEAPRWRDGRLWWSDMHGDRVQSWAPGNEPRQEAEVPNRPSGLGWLADGDLLIVSMMDRKLLRRTADGALTTHADLAAIAPSRLNDMVVDARGRAYIGNFGFEIDDAGPLKVAPTVLAMVEPDGRARVVADGLIFSNGAVITPDGKTLIVAETWGVRLTAFDIDANGDLSRQRLWAALPADDLHDGICLDAEGCIWVACPMTNSCLRVSEGGEVLQRIDTGRPAFACVLGGAGGRTLYICTAADHDRGRRRADPSGRIVAVEVAAPAAADPT